MIDTVTIYINAGLNKNIPNNACSDYLVFNMFINRNIIQNIQIFTI